MIHHLYFYAIMACSITSYQAGDSFDKQSFISKAINGLLWPLYFLLNIKVYWNKLMEMTDFINSYLLKYELYDSVLTTVKFIILHRFNPISQSEWDSYKLSKTYLKDKEHPIIKLLAKLNNLK